MPTARSILAHHDEICTAYEALLREENRRLRNGLDQGDATERRRQLLPELDRAVTELRALRETSIGLNPLDQERARDLRKRMMRLFLLDRENEQLLLKQSVRSKPEPAVVPGQHLGYRASQAYAH